MRKVGETITRSRLKRKSNMSTDWRLKGRKRVISLHVCALLPYGRVEKQLWLEFPRSRWLFIRALFFLFFFLKCAILLWRDAFSQFFGELKWFLFVGKWTEDNWRAIKMHWIKWKLWGFFELHVWRWRFKNSTFDVGLKKWNCEQFIKVKE